MHTYKEILLKLHMICTNQYMMYVNVMIKENFPTKIKNVGYLFMPRRIKYDVYCLQKY